MMDVKPIIGKASVLDRDMTLHPRIAQNERSDKQFDTIKSLKPYWGRRLDELNGG
jgi:hypothetical protein